MNKVRELSKIAALHGSPCRQTHTHDWKSCPPCLLASGTQKSSQDAKPSLMLGMPTPHGALRMPCSDCTSRPAPTTDTHTLLFVALSSKSWASSSILLSFIHPHKEILLVLPLKYIHNQKFLTSCTPLIKDQNLTLDYCSDPVTGLSILNSCPSP